MAGFKQEIADVRDRYVKEIQTMGEKAAKGKAQISDKIEKIKSQSSTAEKKNEEIEAVNLQIKKEL